MKNFLRNLLVSVCTVAVVSASSCCLPGQVLTAGQECRSVVSNKTAPLSLVCPGGPDDGMMVVDKSLMPFVINDLGQLQFILPNRIVTYDPNVFCVGLADDKNSSSFSHVAMICNDEEKRMFGEDVYGYCMMVSALFLVATAGLYATGDNLRDLLGKSFINLCVSLASGLFILVVMRLVPYTDMNWCAVRGFLAYFFVLVSFFWMNVVSTQILLERKHGQSLDATSEKKHYALYVAYAWGVPATLTLIMAFINFMPGDHLKPGIGLNHCWFFDTTQQWHYMYSVMAVLIVCNSIIFGTITVSVCCYGQTQDSFRIKFGTCVRLFVVMGIPWIFEMISSLTPRNMCWDIIDLFNALQGVWIFLVLVVFRPREKRQQAMLYKMNIATIEPPYLKLDK